MGDCLRRNTLRKIRQTVCLLLVSFTLVVKYDMATYCVAVSESVSVDIVSPEGRTTVNAIVGHTMSAALTGASVC